MRMLRITNDTNLFKLFDKMFSAKGSMPKAGRDQPPRPRQAKRDGLAGATISGGKSYAKFSNCRLCLTFFLRLRYKHSSYKFCKLFLFPLFSL